MSSDHVAYLLGVLTVNILEYGILILLIIYFAKKHRKKSLIIAVIVLVFLIIVNLGGLAIRTADSNTGVRRHTETVLTRGTTEPSP